MDENRAEFSHEWRFSIKIGQHCAGPPFTGVVGGVANCTGLQP